MSQFHTATLKLTGWYLAILMLVSLSFSTVIYQITASELDRPLPPGSQVSTYLSARIDEFREARANESKAIMLGNLVILNFITLGLGAGASYFFARRTLQPIENAMEAQARFTSDASHELRTPLAVMRTENEVALRTKSPSVKALKDTLASNLEEVERLQLLTDRLLALSSEQSLELEPFTVSDAVTEAIARHTLAAEQKHIAVKYPAKKLRAIGNIDTVCDIVSILVDNAIKYSPDKTTVNIGTKLQGNHVLLTVADEGDGIDTQDIDHIFDRFYRADQSRSKQHVEGHGLGLALAKRLSDLNDAALSVANRKPRGAVFTLQLPKASD